MTYQDRLFLSLLRLALGTSKDVPQVSFAELKGIYETAKKQLLVGILYVSIEKGDIRPTDTSEHQEELEDLLMSWMADKIKIERRNKKVDSDVVEAIQQLQADGFECCLLKGQGNALLYPRPALRTPGDIDLWVRSRRANEPEQSVQKSIAYVRGVNPHAKASYHHVGGLDKNGTEIELHYRPHFMQNGFYNRRLQHYFNGQTDRQFSHKVKLGTSDVAVPTQDFNVIFQLSHIYQHLFNEGIGLRQIVDYFYVLKSRSPKGRGDAKPMQLKGDGQSADGNDTERQLRELGLLNIAKALMWILITILGMPSGWAIVPPDERRGRFVLSEILRGGNFGKYDERNRRFGRSWIGRNTQRMVRDLRLVRYFPSEALSEPFFRLWHAWWRVRHN